MKVGSTLKLVVLVWALAQATGAGVVRAAPAALPADPRLDPVRPRLEAIVSRTAEAGLPADLVVSKIREGLAKGVPAAGIEAAAARLSDGLQAARSFAAARRSTAALSPDLVRALAEARLAGMDLSSADPVVRAGRPDAETARAVEVLTDLSLRGYPSGRAAGVVKDLFTRDPIAVGRLPATLEVLRREQALSHADTLDALARSLPEAASLEAASVRAAADERVKSGGRGHSGRGQGAGGNREGFVPPGQLKKQSGSKGRPSEHRGRGRMK